MNIHDRMIDIALSSGQTLTLTTYTYLPPEREYLDQVLFRYLTAAGFDHLASHLSYILHELGGNAKKANTKRIYFRERELDIHDPDHYALGMVGFKQDTISSIDEYLSMQEDAGLYIKFRFKRNHDHVLIAVANNVPLLPQERERIREKLQLAAQPREFHELFPEAADNQEGAGLGIIMMVQMLRNLGLGEKALRVFSDAESTIAAIRIPMNTSRISEIEERELEAVSA